MNSVNVFSSHLSSPADSGPAPSTLCGGNEKPGHELLPPQFPPIGIMSSSSSGSVSSEFGSPALLCGEKSASSSTSSFHTIQVPPLRRLSTLRILFAHIGAALALFLATTDSTIVSTSLPTIANEFGASQDQYTRFMAGFLIWSVERYVFADIVWADADVAKRTLILVVVVRSGPIHDMADPSARLGGDWWWWYCELCLGNHLRDCRGTQKGSMVPSSEYYLELLGDSRASSWRGLQQSTLILAELAVGILSEPARLERQKDASWKLFLQKFDFVGLSLFITGSCCIIVGFSFASSNGWTAPSTLTLIIIGPVILACASWYEVRTSREALFPPAAFKDSAIVIILVVNFYTISHLMRAINNTTPLTAGLMLLPYSLGSSLASIPAAWFIGYRQQRTHDTSGQKLVICIGLAVSCIGFGLLHLLGDRSPRITQSLLPMVAGFGLGFLFHAPYQIFTNTLQPKELATGTSAFFLVRFTGATVGLAVAGAVFQNQLSHTLPPSFEAQGFQSFDMGSLNSLSSPMEISQALHAVASSIEYMDSLHTLLRTFSHDLSFPAESNRGGPRRTLNRYVPVN
ncbi:hypothetical protein EW146_g2825 [Bondarzewia mesenterica]|uniref:Major facilitator superfamily (MFS) profile domain-containing protein n=1 Tax=Bondarzewia mesenterica TaxID=1095465 RepID=A0A4S4M1S0_9AGAM|nr:hypothetical protein EW146_g2825 [Bondarzewia mesenterica]